jgi:hypothetical protein
MVLITKNWKKITAEKKLDIFLVKNYNFVILSLGLHKGHTSYRRSLQPPPKKTSSTSKHEYAFTFFLYLPVIFALLDPDPDTGTQINAAPDPVQIYCRSRFFLRKLWWF